MDKKEKLTQIVKEVQKDRGQFESLYSLIVNKVYFWCYVVVGSEADALDASQDAMFLIYKKLNTLKNPEMFSSWMYRVVRNSCLDYLKKNNRYDSEFLHSNDYEESFESTIKDERRDSLPNEVYDLNETKKLVIKFIDNLPKKQREVITLHYLEEYKIEEIAQLLDYNAGSVKSRLHAGRKNLEMQIEEYQNKNKVKLYNIAIIPMLGLLLQEYQNEICDKQNFQFHNDLYKMNHLMRLSNLVELLSTKILIISSIVVLVGIAGLVYSNLYEEPAKNIDDISYIKDKDTYEQIKKSPYVESIEYISFPTRMSVDVTIKLKKEVNKEDIKVLFNDENIHFNQDGLSLIVQISENGKYKLVIDNKEIIFYINVIDEYAPEVVEVQRYHNYLQLIVNDELSQINYDISYVEYNGRKIKINKNNQVYGSFDEKISVTIFDYNNHRIQYDFDFSIE
ncbi:RNA polymerase sigma factor [Breznakia pachnodae]|uniref:RNA polymerase sigma factor (Sigma-70 family) n=1 Tax=Breznakia pachnodae TaxID=265178 RepID=A0ABU0E189_9FIRM|nr:RNA polymerase sigma factor [Breznakia pachnodae]MDQ0360646.1 RNA polymerase sigma factor (sigma-70 family) [Breznakia pachnodae]